MAYRFHTGTCLLSATLAQHHDSHTCVGTLSLSLLRPLSSTQGRQAERAASRGDMGSESEPASGSAAAHEDEGTRLPQPKLDAGISLLDARFMDARLARVLLTGCLPCWIDSLRCSCLWDTVRSREGGWVGAKPWSGAVPEPSLCMLVAALLSLRALLGASCPCWVDVGAKPRCDTPRRRARLGAGEGSHPWYHGTAPASTGLPEEKGCPWVAFWGPSWRAVPLAPDVSSAQLCLW